MWWDVGRQVGATRSLWLRDVDAHVPGSTRRREARQGPTWSARRSSRRHRQPVTKADEHRIQSSYASGGCMWFAQKPSAAARRSWAVWLSGISACPERGMPCERPGARRRRTRSLVRSPNLRSHADEMSAGAAEAARARLGMPVDEAPATSAHRSRRPASSCPLLARPTSTSRDDGWIRLEVALLQDRAASRREASRNANRVHAGVALPASAMPAEH